MPDLMLVQKMRMNLRKAGEIMRMTSPTKKFGQISQLPDFYKENLSFHNDVD